MEEMRERILKIAKEHLFKDEERFSMRNIAKSCGISAGTIYNYFPDKGSLIASIMIEDWHVSLRNMKEKVDGAASFTEGMVAIYDEIRAFSNIYRKVWHGYDARNEEGTLTKRHRELIDEIAVFIGELVKRFKNTDMEICHILAETILSATQNEDVSREELTRLMEVIEGGIK